MNNISLPHRGVTLLELLVTLTILSLILGISVPAVEALILSNKKSHLVNQYFGAFAYARYQAVSTKTITAICPLDENFQCIDDWNRPISIFPDSDYDASPDSRIIWRTMDPVTDRLRIYSRTGGRGTFHFGPDGMIYGATGSIVICPEDLSTGHMTYIAVNLGGRTRKVTDDNGDGEITLHWGGHVTCN